jgi:hypothetical protein
MTEHSIPVAIAVLGMSVVAQATDIPGAPGLPNILSSVGVVGALVWHMWFVSARLIPKMQRDFNEALDKLRQTFSEEQRAMRLAFETQLDSQRASHRSELHDVRGIAAQAVNAREYAMKLEERLQPDKVPKKAAGE